MKSTIDKKPHGQRKTVRLERRLFLLFIVIALVASAGLAFTTIQERRRIRLVAEYQAYQYAIALLQDVQGNITGNIQYIDGLLGFGVYTIDGAALFRIKSAPIRIIDSDSSKNVSIGNDRIRLLMNFGGNMPPSYSHTRRSDASGRGMAGNPLSARYLFIEYVAPAMAHGISLVSIVGVAAIIALLFAFGLLLAMFKRLESYRAKETKLRELATVGEAARTLAHEVKNPLAIIAVQCSLALKKGGEINRSEIQAIQNEMKRVANLVDRIRQIMIQGESPITLQQGVSET